ncbi:polysaccharide deacetylase family protein [Candidatus Micrarchaeota archaeon]|nr:polysaccharide deacetylase family protein [Candidatus Micrarchaeota archaeon]
MDFLRKAQRGAARLAAPWLFRRYFSKGRKTRTPWAQGKRFCVTISFDYDFPEDVQAIPELLELLESYEVPASHACIGKFVEREPGLHRKILERKDEIINHTYSHPNNETFNPDRFFNKMPEAEQEEEIAGFEKVAHDLLDYQASGFRTPHFGNLHTQSVYDILERRRYRYSSSTTMTTTESWGQPYRPARKDFHQRGKPADTQKNRNNGQRENAKESGHDAESADQATSAYRLWELPMMACPEHYKPLFDSWHCFRSQPPAHAHDGDFFRLFGKSVALAEEYGTYLNFYFDPRDVVHLKDFERSLALLKEKDAWLAKSEDVAAWSENAEGAAKTPAPSGNA